MTAFTNMWVGDWATRRMCVLVGIIALCATFAADAQAQSPLSQANWRLRFVDSEEAAGYAATNAFDGNPGTFWHTQFAASSPPPPHEIQIDLGATYSVSGFRYLPRQDGVVFGDIGQYEFYVSSDGTTWGTALATGTFAASGVEKQVVFTAKSGRYVRLRAVTEVAGFAWSNVAELNVLGTGNQPPNGTITAPALDPIIAPGQSVTFAATGTDSDNNVPLTYRWTFGTGGPAASTLQNPGAVVFPTAGTYTVTLTASDTLGLADPVPDTRTVIVQAGGVPGVISHAGWQLRFADSQETGYAAANAFDGNTATMWHTQFSGNAPPPPHEIQIDLGATYSVSGFRYLPRQDGVLFGDIGQYEFYVSGDGVTWGTAVATGVFASSGAEKQILFAAKTGRYIRLRALSEVGGFAWTNIAELNALGGVAGNQPPESVISSPTGDVVIAPGQSVVFAGSGSDPDNNLPLTYAWTFGVGGPSPSTAQNPGAITFPNVGQYTVSFAVKDATGAVDPTPATRVVSVQAGGTATVISHAGWRLRFVDSEDPAGYAAVNAFDDNPGSMWHTQWLNSSPPPPHEIQIDLGASYAVSGFRYLPRQDGQAFGRISQYEFYVSTDGTTWGTAVATGTLANVGTEQQVLFTAKTGRYIRLRALSEVAGFPWSQVAELNVLGSGNQPPHGVITSPALDSVIAPGQTVTFAGTGTDPDNNVPLTYAWNFGAGGPGPSTAQNPGAIVFPTAGTYTVTLTVRDALGAVDPAPATRTVVVQTGGGPSVISQTAWLLQSVDSQEPGFAGTNAFDGNPATMWHTQFSGAAPSPPHEIQIDLGATYSVSGFRYLPRQDGVLFGDIGQYEFYVSADGFTWGVPVASGLFASTGGEKQVLFTAKTGRYIRLRALSEVGGFAWTDVAELNVLGVPGQGSNQTATLVPRGAWLLKFVDDTEFSDTSSRAGTNVFDGNPATMWATSYVSGGPPPPHEIQIDLGSSYPVVGFQYLPNQLWQAGRVGDYEFYVSADGVNWGAPVAFGSFPDTNSSAARDVMFPAKTGRFIRLRALTEVNQAEFTFSAIAELNVWRASTGTSTPTVTFLQPATSITVPVGSAVSFAGTGTGTGLSSRWSVTPGSGVPDFLNGNMAAVHFNRPGTFTVNLTVTDAFGVSVAATRTVTVLSGTPLATTGWSLRSVDSQDVGYAGGNAFDGNPGTMWHTQWQTASPPPPHEIQIDLGATREVSGFRYLPRQDGLTVGNIADYAFFVSTDGVTWGAPVGVGTLAADSSLKEVLTLPKAGRYIRLRAYHEVNGLPYTAIAELQILQRQCAAPSVQLTSPRSLALQTSSTLQINAVTCPSVAGQGVKFVVDGLTVATDFTAPFGTSVSALGQGEHVVEAYLVDSNGNPVAGDATYDVASRVGIGEYYVAVGDGITSGYGDDIAGDDNSADGRSLTGGYPAILGNLLTAAKGHPVVVVNRGQGGGSSKEGLESMDRVLDEHPNAQFILFNYGHNDMLLNNRPSGRGLVPGQAGYAGSYKDVLQQVINKTRARGKTLLLFKPSPVLPLNSPVDVRMIEYVAVIEELYNDTSNGMTVRPPDGFAFFGQHTDQYHDNVVMNGAGYQSMANLWFVAITNVP